MKLLILIGTFHRCSPWTMIKYRQLTEDFTGSDGIDHPATLNHVEFPFIGHVQTTPCSFRVHIV